MSNTEVKSKKVTGKKPEQNIRGRRLRKVFSYFCLFTFVFLLSSVTNAQDDPPDGAPPPLKVFSKDEQDRLDAKKDLKDRTKLALELMDQRLTAAEKFAGSSDFDPMFRELGGFHALMDESIDHLNGLDTGKNKKVLDNFKRLEIGLRAFSSRIEVIRRDVPISYDNYVVKLIKYVRDARTQATEPLFGNTVLPNRKPGN